MQFFLAIHPYAAEEQTTGQQLHIATARTAGDTGVIDFLIERFEQDHPQLKVKLHKVGALTALEMGEQGKIDLVITHYPPEELRFMENHWGTHRIEFMASHYAIFGPKDDPLKIQDAKDALTALRMLQENEVDMYVPSPRSGTYRKIEELWASAGREPTWVGYINTKVSGLATLQQTASEEAYTVAEMGLYLRNQTTLKDTIRPLFRDDIRLQNVFSAMVVSRKANPQANTAMAEAFLEFLIAPQTQKAISAYSVRTFGTALYAPIAHIDKTVIARQLKLEAAKIEYSRNIWLIVSSTIILTGMLVLFYQRKSYKNKLDTMIVKKQLSEAQIKNQAKSDFLSRISHDLRTPLNAVIGYSDICKEEIHSDPATCKDYLDKVINAGHYMVNLIDELLELSRIETQNMPVTIENIDTRALITECIDLCTFYKSQNNIDLVFEIEEQDLAAQADRQRLKQILLNLLSNAYKYNSQNGKIIVKAHKPDHGLLRINISDTGIGLTDEERSHLFNPYYRAEKSSSKVQGTGLGLVICKELAELMHGRLGVDSTPGQGSTFWIEIPSAAA